MPVDTPGSTPTIMPPIQSICETLGRSGCYIISLLEICRDITGVFIDPVQAYAFCVTKGWLGADCYVKDPEAILFQYTGKRFRVRKEPRGYKIQPGERAIARYEKVATRTLNQVIDGHFVKVQADGSIWDPYFQSATVRDGQVVSYRIITEVA